MTFSSTDRIFRVVDLSALRWNLAQTRSRLQSTTEILAVVKGDAYGHGDLEVAKALRHEGVAHLGVASVDEGVHLRQLGIDGSIVVMGGFYPEQVRILAEHTLTAVITEPAVLDALEAFGSKAGITLSCHLKVDTGMGRLGFLPDDSDSWIPKLEKLTAVRLDGVMSHFSEAERVGSPSSRRQLESFRRIIKQLRAAGHRPRLAHMANSAALVLLPESHFNLVRPGGMLYGLFSDPSLAEKISLEPVLAWKTRVLQVKKVPKGFGVSYGETFVTKRESTIAVLSVGYADGYKRNLSNRAAVLIHGQRAPVVGAITMDLTMADVTDIAGVQQGDEVVLLGRQDNAKISAEELAGWADTISYEILTSISSRVPRYYVKQQEDQVSWPRLQGH